MTHDERRGSRRFDLSWPIWVMHAEKEVAHGKTANISRSGAYFQSAALAAVEPGMTVAVRIGIPGKPEGVASVRTVEGDARVVRYEEEDGGCGIALHFREELDPFAES